MDSPVEKHLVQGAAQGGDGGRFVAHAGHISAAHNNRMTATKTLSAGDQRPGPCQQKGSTFKRAASK